MVGTSNLGSWNGHWLNGLNGEKWWQTNNLNKYIYIWDYYGIFGTHMYLHIYTIGVHHRSPCWAKKSTTLSGDMSFLTGRTYIVWKRITYQLGCTNPSRMWIISNMLLSLLSLLLLLLFIVWFVNDFIYPLVIKPSNWKSTICGQFSF